MLSMTVDPKDCLKISEVLELFPGCPDRKTVRNWIVTGCRGVKLRAIVCGTRYFTTEEWVKDFIERTTTSVNAAQVVEVENPKDRQNRAEASRSRIEKRWGKNAAKTKGRVITQAEGRCAQEQSEDSGSVSDY